LSGVAGGTRIQKADVQKTFDKYVKEILNNIDGFKKATLSGSVKVGAKPDYGDLDIITHFQASDKKQAKQNIISLVKSKPDSLIVPFKSERYQGRKYYNSGEIITVLYPIEGKQDQFIQIDNIIALSDEEHGFKNNFLDVPAAKQGLILGLAKVILLEENPSQVFSRLGIKDIPTLQDDEELEFNLSSNKLTLRKVKLQNFKTISKQEVWSSTDWSLINKLFKNYNIDGSFEQLLQQIKSKVKNPRSKKRIKGLFNSMVSIKSGEVGTPKGQGKQQALDAVNSLLENTETTKSVGLYAGGFKPPHKMHFKNAQLLGSKVDKLIVFVGPKVREGIKITAKQSRDIWQIYSLYLNVPVEIIISQTSPIKDLYDWVDQNKDQYKEVVTGAMASEMSKFKYFEKNKQNYSNIQVVTLPELKLKKQDSKFSASTIRSSKDYVKSAEWIPNKISSPDKKNIVNIALQNAPTEKEVKMQEAMEQTLDELFTNKKQKMKNEGSSGTHIGPNSVTRSENRQQLVNAYKMLNRTLNTDNFDINFNQDHIIVKVRQEGERFDFDYTPYMSSILEHMMNEEIKITPLPEIKIRKDIKESANFFGRTAHYNPNENTIVLYTHNRHPKDVMRSFTHEMIHHKQNLEGKLKEVQTADTNNDSSLLELEKEAYLEGNIVFRNWEDGVKNS